MSRSLMACVFGLLLCQACAFDTTRNNTTRELLDVSSSGCTASILVYDSSGVPFINDGCTVNRIFLGIDGKRRKLTRNEGNTLGTGSVYTNGDYQVFVQRGKLTNRTRIADRPAAACAKAGQHPYDVAHDAHVHIWSAHASWVIDGTMRQTQCAP